MKEKPLETRQDAAKRLMEITSQSEAFEIMRIFGDTFRNEFPFIEVADYKDGKPESYKSTIEDFPAYLFHTELEANLANALFMIWKENGKPFREEKFRIVFQMVLTLLDIESEWRF